MATLSFEILGSRLAEDTERHARLTASVRAHAARLHADERAERIDVLYADLFSEYDARFLDLELRRTPRRFGEAFWACERAWRADEEQHYLGFRAIYSGLTGRAPESIEAEMAARAAEVDFAPIAGFLRDEVTLACLFAYDEAATVRAYRASRAAYERLGPEAVAFVREVIADEGRHVRNFVKLLRSEHAGRLDEIEGVVDAIRAHEHGGAAYAGTFVLDHDDGVWNEAIFDAAADLVRRRLRAPARVR